MTPLRTGAPVVTWCPGDPVTPVGNPGCTGGLGFPNGGSIPGGLRYTALTTRMQGNSQFGGNARAAVTGSADVALRGGLSPAPCSGASCIAVFALASPAGTGAQGGAWNAPANTAGAAPSPGVAIVTIPFGSASPWKASGKFLVAFNTVDKRTSYSWPTAPRFG